MCYDWDVLIVIELVLSIYLIYPGTGFQDELKELLLKIEEDADIVDKLNAF